MIKVIFNGPLKNSGLDDDRGTCFTTSTARSEVARRKAALVIEMIQGKATVAEASRSFNLTPSEIEGWKEVAKRAMQNSLRAKPLDNREQFATQFKGLQEGLQADGSAVSIATRTSTVACASACRPAK